MEGEKGGDFLKGRLSSETKMKGRRRRTVSKEIGGNGMGPQQKGSRRDLTEMEAGSQTAGLMFFLGGWGRAPLRGALKAMVGSSCRGRPLGQRVSLGQVKCGGHMVIVGEEPCAGGKALERRRVKTLQEVPGRPQGRKGGGAPRI